MMGIGVLTWICDFALSHGASAAVEKFNSPTLNKELDNAMHKWSKKLPKAQRFDEYTSLFNSSLIKKEPAPKDVLQIAMIIDDGKIPGKDDWFKALFFLWKQIKETVGKDAQPFYLLDEATASTHLRQLSKALEMVCIDNEKLFKGTVIDRMDELLNETKEVKSLLKEDKSNEFISNLNVASPHEKLRNSLFLVEFETQTCLGVSISNSGLIVCSGHRDTLKSVRSLKTEKECSVVKHIVNGPHLHFISIKGKTTGLVPRYNFDGRKNEETVFTFDKDGNTISGKVFNFSFFIFDFLDIFQKIFYGFIPIILDDIYEASMLTSCPVFNSHLEFVGISFGLSQLPYGKEASTAEQKSSFLVVLSCEEFSHYVTENSSFKKK
jgi:hypothetical protein